MTDYNDGLIHGWNSGECPVHIRTVVKFWLRGGSIVEDAAGLARWLHIDSSGDIIAFRVVEPHFEPKTVWVNEYPDGRPRSYNSKHGATNAARDSATRIAVEFREVRK
jgi:hypothetical protein